MDLVSLVDNFTCELEDGTLMKLPKEWLWTTFSPDSVAILSLAGSSEHDLP